MPDTEKITINISVVDLGKIDLLVEEGFYSNRTDLIRTAIRNQLSRHADAVEQITVRKAFAVGVMVYSREDLEAMWEAGKMVNIRVVGMLVIEKDVTPELALATISSVAVRGILQAADAVEAALDEAGRIR